MIVDGTRYRTTTNVTLDGEHYYDSFIEVDENDKPIHLWNGWLCPWLNRENVERLIRDIDADPNPDNEMLEWDGNVLVVRHPDETYEPDRIEPREIDCGFPVGKALFWNPGSYAWVWTDMDQEDHTVVGSIVSPVEVTMEDIRNISITACEGGIGYWSRMTSGFEKGHATYQYTGEFELEPESENGHETWAEELDRPELPTPLKVDKDVLLRGLQLYCEGKWRQPPKGSEARNVLEDLDADSADVIVQLGLFGEVVYG